MHLFETDGLGMLQRVLCPGHALAMIDVGAHRGATAHRMLQCFPFARVWAFEPSPALLPVLKENTKSLAGLRVVPAACGATTGTVEFHMTQDDYCSSMLAPSALGERYYGPAYKVTQTTRVGVVRLDEWAQREGLTHVDVLKIDAQGAELDVLKGAVGLLRSSVTAVLSEAQLAQEYVGAATFSDIDMFLRDCGFEVYQLHEHWAQGKERRSSYLDCLWLRREALQWLSKRPQAAFEEEWRGRAERALVELLRTGKRRIALYGNGTFARAVGEVFRVPGVEVVAVIDDAADGGARTAQGWQVLMPERVLAMKPDAVVLCSNSLEEQLVEKAKAFSQQGAAVVRLFPELTGVPRVRSVSTPVRAMDQSAASGGGALEMQWSVKASTPEEAFRSQTYLRLNARRLEHLASLGLDLSRKRVLEVGSGVGELTSYFVDRHCRVHALDAREANLHVLRQAYPKGVTGEVLDLDDPGEFAGQAYDVVFCYGLLYHLRDPERALAYMAQACGGMLLLETCVSFGEHEALNPVAEDKGVASQSASGVGCRPTRAWVLARLKKLFPYVYVPVAQPASEEFPLDWTGKSGAAPLSRAVFVASRSAITLTTLTEDLLLRQSAA
jgi:FkbM family methyltransferase